MQVTPYLNFNGNCREAFEFYAQAIGATIEGVHTFGEMPGGGYTTASQNLVMHVCLDLGDGFKIMGSDCPPEMGFQAPAGTSVSLHPTSVEDAERIYGALSEGGTVIMPLQETFWATRFAMFTDRFGVPWMINAQAQG